MVQLPKRYSPVTQTIFELVGWLGQFNEALSARVGLGLELDFLMSESLRGAFNSRLF